MFSAFLVKKETVSGIIGKTHGVSNATKPPKNPIINNDNKPLLCVATILPDDNVAALVSGFATFILGIKILLLTLQTEISIERLIIKAVMSIVTHHGRFLIHLLWTIKRSFIFQILIL